jgi:hypothetical protein
VLQRGDVKVKAETVHLHIHAVEETVGLDVVEHVGLPEERHIPVIGVDLFVHPFVKRGMVETDGAGFGEIAAEKGIEAVKEFLAELGERFQCPVNVFFQAREDALFVVAGFDAHQVDEAGLAFHPGANENIPQGVEKPLLLRHRVLLMGIGTDGRSGGRAYYTRSGAEDKSDFPVPKQTGRDGLIKPVPARLSCPSRRTACAYRDAGF